ncbi:MAG: hypothetical protein WCF85_18610 [Rhodospirillaceae bacterium]
MTENALLQPAFAEGVAMGPDSRAQAIAAAWDIEHLAVPVPA